MRRKDEGREDTGREGREKGRGARIEGNGRKHNIQEGKGTRRKSIEQEKGEGKDSEQKGRLGNANKRNMERDRKRKRKIERERDMAMKRRQYKGSSRKTTSGE